MPLIPEFRWPDVSLRKKALLLKHALTVLEAQQAMTTRTGKNILHYTLNRARQHEKMRHYPKGDRIDYQSGAQYFYHCHREDLEREEHGHFHCFLRGKRIPPRIKPTSLPDWDKNISSPMAHVIAIAMNRYGQPIRLFTVNRWVSYETWYDARHITSFLKQYRFTPTEPSRWDVLDQWTAAMVQLFAAQITWLHEERDAQIAAFQKLHPTANAYEDTRLEELSEIPINLAQQIQWLNS